MGEDVVAVTSGVIEASACALTREPRPPNGPGRPFPQVTRLVRLAQYLQGPTALPMHRRRHWWGGCGLMPQATAKLTCGHLDQQRHV